MRKKVFSMTDLQSAVSSASYGSPIAAATPMGMGVQVVGPGASMGRTGHGIPDGDYDIGVDSDTEFDEELEEQKPKPKTPLKHTSGMGGMKRVMSSLNFFTKRNDSVTEFGKSVPERADKLLVVFDMDHTMVGDLVSLSDRDNIESNVAWTYWPEGKDRGLSPAYILQYLRRGMLRPGLLELLAHLRSVGATIVVYTHSEEKWAIKVCEAMERMAGWPFIKRVFSRMDCKDGHPNFRARKSLEFVCEQLKAQDGLDWVKVDRTIMFDDDGNALAKHESDRLVKVASYDHWEKCQWDESVNEDMMARNPHDLADLVRCSAVEWGLAPPSYAKRQASSEDELRRWTAAVEKKESILLSFNKIAALDRVMYDVLDAMMDLSDLRVLPQKVRKHLSNQVQPQTRRKPG